MRDAGLTRQAAIARRLDSADAMLVLANVLWSLNYATTKFAFRAWEPLAFALTRFTVAGVLFSAFVWRREGSLRVRRSDIPLVLGAAAVGILLNQLTFNYAVDRTSAGNVALILASSPAFAALFASALRHEQVRPRHYLALGVSIAGVAVVIEGGAGLSGVSLTGDLLAVGAAVTWAAYAVMLRPLFARYSAARISALMIVVGAVMLLPFALPQTLSQNWGAIRPLHASSWAYSAVFPLLVTNLLYFRALRRIGASRATLYMYLQPFLGALFAAALLGERVTPLEVVGGIVIVAGVSVGQLMPGATVRE
jgi:drug/metabolite transporter (DMT)-like permease